MSEAEPRIYTAEESRLIRKRQASRSRVLGVILVALAILFFAITIVKIGVWG
ncbi:MAG: hypothetical protein V3V15_10545 [Sphingorhabdus sp.]